MGFIILIVAFVTETVLAAYRLISHANQGKIRSYIWIGAFATFLLFTLMSVIQWSFRWYLLAGLLFVWAVIGAWRLLRHKPDTKAFSAVRTVFSSIGVLLLVFIAVIPTLIFPQFTPPKLTGEHAVATANFTYTDENHIETFTTTGENRKVNVGCWYPKDGGGPYPLVVFSHGTGGIKISNSSTFLELASNGYVVCAIDHPYHALFTLGSDGAFTRIDPAYWQEYLDVVNHKIDEAARFGIEHKWLSLRVADMDFVVNSILAQVKESDSAALYRLIDPAKIGLIGHSIGGAASGQLARERDDISAVINLDGDLLGEYVDFVNGSEVLNPAPYPVPLLNVYTDDMMRLIETVPNADEIVGSSHAAFTSPNGYEVHLKGANHFSVTDLPLVAPALISIMRSSIPSIGAESADPHEINEKMNALVLQFFNAYLKGEATIMVDETLFDTAAR